MKCVCEAGYAAEAEFISRSLGRNELDGQEKSCLCCTLSSIKSILEAFLPYVEQDDHDGIVCKSLHDLRMLLLVNRETFWNNLLTLLEDKDMYVRFASRKCLSTFVMVVSPSPYVKRLVNSLIPVTESFTTSQIFYTIEDIIRSEERSNNKDAASAPGNCGKKITFNSNGDYGLYTIGLADVKKTLVDHLSIEWLKIVQVASTTCKDCLLALLSAWSRIVMWINGSKLFQESFKVFYNSIYPLFIQKKSVFKSQIVTVHFLRVIHQTLNFIGVVTSIDNHETHQPGIETLQKCHSLEFWSQETVIGEDNCCFTGAKVGENHGISQSHSLMKECVNRKITSIVMESMVLRVRLVQSDNFNDDVSSNLSAFQSSLMTKLNGTCSRFSKLLVEIFIEQDNSLVECLLYCLEMYVNCRRSDDLCSKYSIHPDIIFYDFIDSLGRDYQVLLDMLVNSETYFLLYLIKYLKFRKYYFSLCESKHPKEPSNTSSSAHLISFNHARSLPETLQDNSVLECELDRGEIQDAIKEILEDLYFSIKRLHKAELFPYNPKPLLKLLQAVIRPSESQLH